MPRAAALLLSASLVALTLPFQAGAQTIAAGANPADKNTTLNNADLITRDSLNNVIIATGHQVELVQGPNMLLADRIVWNRSSDIVNATGNVKLVDDKGNIYFGDYLEITGDMRQGFMNNVSALMADNSRLVGRQAEKEGDVTTINRGVYSPCALCATDPTQPPTWELKAVKVVHDTDAKRIYYHDATFDIDGTPVLWTPYWSSYDPSVKRADGFLETMPGYRSQLGFFTHSSYYFDLAPDIDAILDGGYYSLQGPTIGGEYRERFDSGQILFQGSLAESDIRANPTPLNQNQKIVQGDIFGTGEFDLSDNWRSGFQIARSEDSIYVHKYGISSLDVLPSHAYVEGFYDRDYFSASAYSFQDLRPGITQKQPYALPYINWSLFGDPGALLGGRWADSGSILSIQRYPGQTDQRITNNLSWERQLISSFGLVTQLNASVETDYYWTQNPQPDPITTLTTAAPATGRFFPQANAVVSYPLVNQFDYAKVVIEPTVSALVSPVSANNKKIPDEDSQDIELDESNLFSGNRFPGVDRIDDGARVAYGVKTGIYNLGTGYTTIFLGQSYRLDGHTKFPPSSGLSSGASDYVGQIEIYPGSLIDIDYRLELSDDFKQDRLQEINFRVGPDNYGIYGTYLFAAKVDVPDFITTERNEMTMAAYYKFDQNWMATVSSTTELTHPIAVLRYSLSAGYTDDCSTFTLNVTHDQTLPVGGTSGTAVFLQFTLKNLGVFRTPVVH